jgi:hypothetical protein
MLKMYGKYDANCSFVRDRLGGTFCRGEFKMEDLLYQNMIPSSAIMAKTEIFKKFPYDLNIRLCDDWERWIDFYYKGVKIKHLCKVLGEYRFHDNNTVFKCLDEWKVCYKYVKDKYNIPKIGYVY